MARIYCAYDNYYGDHPARQLAHGFKRGDPAAIKQMANDLAGMIHNSCVLVPIPNSGGLAVATQSLAEMIVSFLRALTKLEIRLEPVMRGNARQSLYDCKKEGKQMDEPDFGFRLTSAIPDGKKIYLLDNVLATGQTASAALKLIPSADVLVHSVDKKTFEASAYRDRFSEVITGVQKERLSQKEKQKLKHRL